MDKGYNEQSKYLMPTSIKFVLNSTNTSIANCSNIANGNNTSINIQHDDDDNAFLHANLNENDDYNGDDIDDDDNTSSISEQPEMRDYPQYAATTAVMPIQYSWLYGKPIVGPTIKNKCIKPLEYSS